MTIFAECVVYFLFCLGQYSRQVIEQWLKLDFENDVNFSFLQVMITNYDYSFESNYNLSHDQVRLAGSSYPVKYKNSSIKEN